MTIEEALELLAVMLWTMQAISIMIWSADTMITICDAMRNYRIEKGPADDPLKEMRLFLLTQQNASTLGIPNDVLQIIGEYSDYNEIKTLFRILTTSEDRKRVIGFEYYQKMDKEYPSRISKMQYLRNVNRGFEVDVDGWSNFAFTFDATQTFIQEICLDSFWNGSEVKVEKNPATINWEAFQGFKQLRYLSLQELNLTVSIDDIAKLPDTLIGLKLSGNTWSYPSGDLNLNLLPQNLQHLWVDYCFGMDGLLRFTAPHSQLKELSIIGVEIDDIIDLYPPPPYLKQIWLSIMGTSIPLHTLGFLRSNLSILIN